MTTVDQLPRNLENLTIGACRSSRCAHKTMNPFRERSRSMPCALQQQQQHDANATTLPCVPEQIATTIRKKPLIKQSQLNIIKTNFKTKRRAPLLRPALLRALKTPTSSATGSKPAESFQSENESDCRCFSPSGARNMSTSTLQPAEEDICQEIGSIRLDDAAAATHSSSSASVQHLAAVVDSVVQPPADSADCNVEELACYFDNIVHIPKTMSAMAKMMYS